jgi:hypothetical protein
MEVFQKGPIKKILSPALYGCTGGLAVSATIGNITVKLLDQAIEKQGGLAEIFSNPHEFQTFFGFLDKFIQSGNPKAQSNYAERVKALREHLVAVFEAQNMSPESNPLIAKINNLMERTYTALVHPKNTNIGDLLIANSQFDLIQAMQYVIKKFNPNGVEGSKKQTLDDEGKLPLYEASIRAQKGVLNQLSNEARLEAAKAFSPRNNPEAFLNKYQELLAAALKGRATDFTKDGITEIKEELSMADTEARSIATLMKSPTSLGILSRALGLVSSQVENPLEELSLAIKGSDPQETPQIRLGLIQNIDGAIKEGLSPEKVLALAKSCIQDERRKADVDSILGEFYRASEDPAILHDQADNAEIRLQTLAERLNGLDQEQQAYAYQVINKSLALKNQEGLFDSLISKMSWSSLLVPVIVGILGAKSIGAPAFMGVLITGVLQLMGSNDDRAKPEAPARLAA